MQPIAEWHDVDREKFRREILAQYRPAVLRSVVKSWPAVQRGIESAESIGRYLAALDSGAPVDAIRTPPSAKGRIFYSDDMSGFNFTRDRVPLSSVIGRISKYAKLEKPPAVAVQSALIADCLPGFAAQNVLPILDASVQPRIWLGSAVVTPAHFDESNNIACVVAGHRRFTLFPPEQVANLYIGPLGHAPTGTPISLVSFREPDFKRFPRFGEALATAQAAELAPGDALYIPALWWHHVESLDRFNVLVNYWWREAIGTSDKANSALNSLLLCLLDLRHLAPEQREAWRAIFDHYVFHAGDDLAAHIPERQRGVLGNISPELARQVRAFLVSQLQR